MQTMPNPSASSTAIPAHGSPWRRPVGGRDAWRLGMLQCFTLLMAGRGVCVNETMMLCDPGYARARLRHACTLPDTRLQQIAVEMLSTMGEESHVGGGVGSSLAH